ncbi:MAG: cation-transporting P-type ATPase [Anaerolineae bacterium]|jgi:Ca2+-transporting ATPase
MTENANPSLEQPWTRPAGEVARALDVTPEQGLAAREVRRRRRKHGPNRLRSAQSTSAWKILLDQFKSLLVLLLAVAAILSSVFGEWIEGLAIGAVILINAAIGFFTELRAVRSMEALQRMGSVSARVRRDGQVQEIPAEKLVPGDLVVLQGGDVVTADLRLVEASKLQADESALTGESVPVGKQVEPLDGEIPLAERASMVFKGTAITRGAGEGIVVSTGMDTELGHISSLVEEAEEERTPLEKRLNRLGHKLIGVTLVIAVVVAVSGILAGREIVVMLETAIALAVATVPEGLPIVATIALARGMRRMARRNALINRLSAVETLGATNVICTDKTGTLTENQMTVVELVLSSGSVSVGGEGLDVEGKFSRDGHRLDPTDQEILQRLLQVGVLCNNAELHQNGSGDGNQAVGDPVEIALLVAGAKAGMARHRLLEDRPEVREVAFDPDVKMMATFHRHREDGRFRIAVKGAPEAILRACARILTPEGEKELNNEERQRWLDRDRALAEDGLRVLAAATRLVDTDEAQPYEDLTFLGLYGLLDPPREEVKPSLVACQEAGIQVVMVTGDHPVTARKIARAVGLVEDENPTVIHGSDFPEPHRLSAQERQRILAAPIFARVSPAQKLDLIAIYQDSGEAVAMTGDGVNDAPALKKADIGVAMGRRGTQVAREAADMVLEDDRFSSIVTAVEQGRVIWGNIRRFVLYLLSCNMSEIAVVSLASLVNAPLPIQPLQILYLNLVTDVFPALALGVGEGEEAMMQRPPRDPQEPILRRDHWLTMGGYSLLITFAVLGIFALALTWLGMDNDQAVTVSFLTLAFAQLWHVFNMRQRNSSLLDNEIVNNPWIWGALALCTLLLLLAVYLPGLNTLLKVTDPGLAGWLAVAGASLLPLIGGQIAKALGYGRTA